MRRSTHILVGVMMALSAWAAQGTKASGQRPQVENWRISGTVVDAVSGAPLAKATVLLVSTRGNQEPIATRTTAVDGRFEFDHLAVGKYMLVAQRRGYLTEQLDQHENFSTGVAVGPDLVSDGIVYRLHADSSLSGRVLDEANEAVPNAQVTLFTSLSRDLGAMRQLPTEQTDDKGFFRFSHLSPATYVIAVAAQPWYADHSVAYVRARTPEGTPEVVEPASPLDVAYPLTFYPDATEAESATPITLGAGEHATADVMMRAVPALHLRVHTPGSDVTAPPSIGTYLHKRVFGATVSVSTNAMGGTPGVTEIAGMAPGHYEVSTTVNEGRSQTESRQEIDLAANRDIESTQSAVGLVTVGGMLRIEGEAQAKRRPPVLILSDAKGRRESSAQVKADGTFEFGQAIAAGKYRVILAGAALYLKSVRATGARVSGEEVTIGAAPVKLTLVASDGVGTVDGVALHDERPQSGAMVILVPEDPAGEEHLFRRDQSDSDGSFTLPSVLPGKYVVIAVGRWDIPWRDPETLRHYYAAWAENRGAAEGKISSENPGPVSHPMRAGATG